MPAMDNSKRQDVCVGGGWDLSRFADRQEGWPATVGGGRPA